MRKKIFNTLVSVGVLIILGSVGAMEIDNITAAEAMEKIGIGCLFIVVALLFDFFCGIFHGYISAKRRKRRFSVRGCSITGADRRVA